jgi:hypothetical protein
MALLVGQLNIAVPGPLKSTFFLIFLFAVGYGVVPQFSRVSPRTDCRSSLHLATALSMRRGRIAGARGAIIVEVMGRPLETGLELSL